MNKFIKTIVFFAGTLFIISRCQSAKDNSSVVQKKDPESKSIDFSKNIGDLSTSDEPFDPKVAEEIKDLFAKLIDARHPPGTTNVKRPVFLKPHGCAKAIFKVHKDIPTPYKRGLFARERNFDAWIRISSDTIPTTSDFSNSTVGFSLKLLGVTGRKILQGEENATTHDFLLQNHPVFFVDKASDFLEFTQSIFSGKLNDYLVAKPKTKMILDDMKKSVENVFASRYWSTTPYKFSKNNFSKYSVTSCQPLAPELPPLDDKNYLGTRMARDLQNQEICLEFKLQLRNNQDFPLDEATVEWQESKSAFQSVATIIIPKQDIKANENSCENLSFTPWHAINSHRPVGSINIARGLVYKYFADLRRNRNGIPIQEP